MSVRSDAVDVLSRWPAPTPDQLALRTAFLDHLAQHSDSTDRGCRPAHLTASALVLDTARRHVLLTLHPKVGRWLQTGGHCEPTDATLAGAALREATEESGIDDLRLATPAPVRLDRHPVRCSPDGATTDHLDVQYAVVAPAAAVARRGPESLALRWWPVDALPEGTDGSVRALVSWALGWAGQPVEQAAQPSR